MKDLEDIETSIKNLILSGNIGRLPKGDISCDFGRGFVGHNGNWTSGILKKNTKCITKLLDQLTNKGDEDFSDLLFKLKKISENLERGPLYHLNIKFKRKNFDFEYFWSGDNFSSLDELALTNHGTLPDFIYAKVFNEELISFVKDDEIEDAISYFVTTKNNNSDGVPDNLINLYSVIDWLSDTNNGGLTQYFSRNKDCFGSFSRKELYPRVLKGLYLISLPEAEKLFTEAIALFAHFHKNVESVRKKLDIPPLPMQTESDIDHRYAGINEDIKNKLHTYVKENAKELAVKN